MDSLDWSHPVWEKGPCRNESVNMEALDSLEHAGRRTDLHYIGTIFLRLHNPNMQPQVNVRFTTQTQETTSFYSVWICSDNSLQIKMHQLKL